MDDKFLNHIYAQLIELKNKLNAGGIPEGDKHRMFDSCDGIMDMASEIKRLVALRKN